MAERPTTLARQPEFLKLWAASAISDIGSQITVVALPLIAALTLSASAWEMGLLSAAGSAPIVLVGLLAGVWVDRVRRRPMLIAADAGRAVLLLAIPLASVAGVLRIEMLYAVALLVGVLTVLFDVAYLSFLPSLVERSQLIEGNSKLEATSSAAQVTGPGLGGLLVGTLGAAFAVLLDALSFVVSALFIAAIRVKEVSLPPHDRAGMMAEIGEGLRVVFTDRILRVLVGCSATTNLFGRMFLAVYVLYMTRDLGLGPVGVGLVFSTGGVGALVGALAAERVTRRFGPGPTMTWAQFLFGLTGMAVPLAVLLPRVALPMVVASEFGQWLAVTIYYVNVVSVRQALIPDRLLGRVNATARFVGGGALPIGALLGGALGEAIGLPLTLVVAEFGMLLAFLWLFLSPVRSLRELPTRRHPSPG
jgi:MFS family permease